MDFYLVALIVLAILLFIKFLVVICVYLARKEEQNQRERQLQTVYVVQNSRNRPPPQIVQPIGQIQPVRSVQPVHSVQPVWFQQPIQPTQQYYWQYLEKDQPPPSYLEATQNRS